MAQEFQSGGEGRRVAAVERDEQGADRCALHIFDAAVRQRGARAYSATTRNLTTVRRPTPGARRAVIASGSIG
jgi:hypothetical protein